ncbi:hypothetical protein EMCG_06226 [[Emmonsia] crescens]|uniref:Protein kinase domain-containing protein n=1 Tax=[Emmonsia] crescens TaxID=73230 RepID=A0A0G2JBV0_9EURO|nr:hypothetical protein EMCG_06226 [Emmonsia crescens UAMH 3008]
MAYPSITPLGPEKTIYREETGFDENLKIDINFAEMELIAVLKVFHNNEDPGYTSDGLRDLNRARCEIRAYCSLKRFNICDGGFVPKFYGYMMAINPTSWAPHLNVFQCDIDLPSAILIEYLPNTLPMNSKTYSKERFEKVNIGIQQIHLALIEHNDPYPKNVLIVPGDPERVVWIDFDVAIVYPNENYIGERERGWIESETRCVESYGTMLVCSSK